MIRHVLLLVFLCGIQSGRSSSSPQEQPVESEGKDTIASGIKKNEVGANGFEANWEKVARNFQNPVLEYLLRKNSDRMSGPPQRGVVREIRHSQTLLLPNFLGNPFPGVFTNPISQFESVSLVFHMNLTGGLSEVRYWQGYLSLFPVPIPSPGVLLMPFQDINSQSSPPFATQNPFNHAPDLYSQYPPLKFPQHLFSLRQEFTHGKLSKRASRKSPPPQIKAPPPWKTIQEFAFGFA